MSDININTHDSIGNVDFNYQAAGVAVLTAAFAGRRYVAGGFCKSTAVVLEALKKNSQAAEWHKAGDAHLASARKNLLNDAKIALLAGAAAGATLYAKDNFVFDGANTTETLEGETGEQPAASTPAAAPQEQVPAPQEQAPAPQEQAPAPQTPVAKDGIVWGMCKSVPYCEDFAYPVYQVAATVYKDVSDATSYAVGSAVEYAAPIAKEHPVITAAVGYKFGSFLMGKVVDRRIPASFTAQANLAGIVTKNQLDQLADVVGKLPTDEKVAAAIADAVAPLATDDGVINTIAGAIAPLATKAELQTAVAGVAPVVV